MESGKSHGRHLDAATKDCLKAITVVTEVLRIQEIDFSDYKLISIENLVPSTSPDTWRLTFKLRTLIPKTSQSKLGAGGEIYVQVDTGRKTAELLGYGE